jgi:hypothetical protein
MMQGIRSIQAGRQSERMPDTGSIQADRQSERMPSTGSIKECRLRGDARHWIDTGRQAVRETLW